MLRASMLRTTLALVASLGLMLAGPAGAYAKGMKKGTAKERTFKGEIVSVNTTANEFTVKSTKKGDASELTFTVERPVGLTRDGEVVALGELEKGDPVTVTYEVNGPPSSPRAFTGPRRPSSRAGPRASAGTIGPRRSFRS